MRPLPQAPIWGGSSDHSAAGSRDDPALGISGGTTNGATPPTTQETPGFLQPSRSGGPRLGAFRGGDHPDDQPSQPLPPPSSYLRRMRWRCRLLGAALESRYRVRHLPLLRGLVRGQHVARADARLLRGRGGQLRRRGGRVMTGFAILNDRPGPGEKCRTTDATTLS